MTEGGSTLNLWKRRMQQQNCVQGEGQTAFCMLTLLLLWGAQRGTEMPLKLLLATLWTALLCPTQHLLLQVLT